MVVDLDCRVVCRGLLGTMGDRSGSSLLAPLSGMDSKVGLKRSR
jgi:hypothetical protein